MWMNEHEVERAVDQFGDDTERPNLAYAVKVLAKLVAWTNSHSDGWPYWQKPIRAADRLMNAIQSAQARDRDGIEDDLTDAALKAALRPILAFMTRQAASYDEVLPDAPKDENAEHVALLSTALDAITRYTTATGRLGMHDLSLLDSLRDREGKGALTCTAPEAMTALMKRGEAVFIGGPKGADLWTFFDEDVDETLTRAGLVNPAYDPEADE